MKVKYKGAFTKDVRLTPPGGGSEKPDKTGRWGRGGRGGFEILGRPKAKKMFSHFYPFFIFKELVQHLE